MVNINKTYGNYNKKIDFKFIENLYQNKDPMCDEKKLKLIYNQKDSPTTQTELMFKRGLESFDYIKQKDVSLKNILVNVLYLYSYT